MLYLETFPELRASFEGRGDRALSRLPFCRITDTLVCRTTINPSPPVRVRLAMQLIHTLRAEGIIVHSSMRLSRHIPGSMVRIVVIPATLFEIETVVIGERMRLLPAWATLLVTKVEPAFALSCEASRILPVCVRRLVFSLMALEKDENRDGACYTEQTEANNKRKEA